MNWLFKVAAFKLLSVLPGGTVAYRHCQEKLTHSLTPTTERVGQKIDIGLRYWDWVLSHQPSGEPVSHLDFGTGWHPTIPLLCYSLGVEKQYLFDATSLLDRRMVESTVKVFHQIVNAPGWPHRARLKRLPELPWPGDLPWRDYLTRMGMTYDAPVEEKIGQINGTLDFASSTQVLLHVPREVVRRYFRELHRGLKKNGKFLATIYLWDLHANAANGISKYNHLRYSPETWEKWVNSRLMSYNRLKAADYRQLLEEAGFQIREFDVTGPTAADLRELDGVPIHDYFKRYSRDELGATHLFFAAEKV